MSGGDRLRGRRRHRQHLRQVRLEQPGRAPADGAASSATSTSCSRWPRRARCWTSAAARACSCSAGRSACDERARGRHRPGGGVDPGRLGRAPGAQPRIPRDAGRRTCRSPTNEFDLASAIEVLEHVPDPAHTLARDGALRRAPPARVGAARAAVADAEHGARRLLVGSSGNTPGHLNHWSRRSFVALLSRHGEVVEVRSPFPWTMLLVRL